MPAASSVHEFGPFRLDTRERLLLRAGQPVSLTPKAFDLLIYLVERHGRLVSKKDLLSAVWSDTFVEEANLTYTISALRRALGDSQDGERYIQTVPTLQLPLPTVTLRTPVVICYRCDKCGESWTVGKPGFSSAPHRGSVLSRREGARHRATSPPSCPPRHFRTPSGTVTRFSLGVR